MNDQLISIDDDSLDQVAGGGWTFSVTIPKPSEVIGAGLEAVGDVTEAAVDGIGDLLGLFDISIG